MNLKYIEIMPHQAEELSAFEKLVYGEKEGWGVESVKKYFDNFGLKAFFAFGEDEEKPIGIVAYTVEKQSLAWIATNAVVEQHRRKGISTKMLDWCFDRIKSEGHKQVSLWVKTDNTPAVTMYKKLGFTYDEDQEVRMRMRMTLVF